MIRTREQLPYMFVKNTALGWPPESRKPLLTKGLRFRTMEQLPYMFVKILAFESRKPLLTKGSFTLATFVGDNTCDSDTRLYLPWPHWAVQLRWDHSYFLSHRPRFLCRWRYRANLCQFKCGFTDT